MIARTDAQATKAKFHCLHCGVPYEQDSKRQWVWRHPKPVCDSPKSDGEPWVEHKIFRKVEGLVK